MKSLDELYREITRDEENWSYYMDCDGQNPYQAIYENRAPDFIWNYFINHGKHLLVQSEAAVKDYFQSNDKSQMRCEHMLSVYLLGIAIARILGIDVYTRDEQNVSFLYVWYLTVLYHDVGYAYEEMKKSPVWERVCNNGIEGFAEYERLDKECITDELFMPYNREQIEEYFKRKSEKYDGVDHGISGGVLLNCLMYKQLSEQLGVECTGEKAVEVRERKLFYSDRVIPYWKKAANAIIVHNIFSPTMKEYLEACRIPFCAKKTKRELSRNPFAYILGIADTIEPIKRFDGEIDSNEILKIIQIETDEDGHLTLSAPQKLGNGRAKQWIGGINELRDWLKIDCKESKQQNADKELTINITLDKHHDVWHKF